MQEADQPFSRNWRWTLASGLFTALLAVMAFLLPAIEWMPRGGLVGWLLFLTGISELTFGWKRGLDTVRSEEHTSELQSLMRNSYAVFCLKQKNKQINKTRL